LHEREGQRHDHGHEKLRAPPMVRVPPTYEIRHSARPLSAQVCMTSTARCADAVQRMVGTGRYDSTALWETCALVTAGARGASARRRSCASSPAATASQEKR